MKNIEAIFEFCPNYIYHMLSISNCGYKNQYGSMNKNLHNQNDLKIINEASILLTVSGGPHMGKLYDVIISNPAGYFSKYTEAEVKNAINICKIFEKNIEIYQKNYFENEKLKAESE